MSKLLQWEECGMRILDRLVVEKDLETIVGDFIMPDDYDGGMTDRGYWLSELAIKRLQVELGWDE